MNADLAFVRNQLRSGNYSQDIEQVIKQTISLLKDRKTPFAHICKQACLNALDDIAFGKYKLASYEINLIHNMPINAEEIQAWDEEHFYLYELPVYFEHVEDMSRVKRMLILLANLANF